MRLIPKPAPPSLVPLDIYQGYRLSILPAGRMCAIIVSFVGRPVVFTSCLENTDSSSFAASLVLFAPTRGLLCSVRFSYPPPPAQSIHVNRRKVESDNSEPLVAYKMLLYKQACFPKRDGLPHVRSVCPLAFDEGVSFLLRVNTS